MASGEFKPIAYRFASDSLMYEETFKCMHCPQQPCCSGCPCHCSPKMFLWALRTNLPSDFELSTAYIYQNNPFGGVCGVVCPDTFCQLKCSRKKLDTHIEIPKMQAAVVKKARDLGRLPKVHIQERKSQKFAIIGGGPAGISAAAYLGTRGYSVDIFEKDSKLGGACNLIPSHRLARDVIQADCDFWTKLETINVHLNESVSAEDLAAKYDAVGVSVGLTGSRALGIAGEDAALDFRFLLRDPESFRPRVGKKVVVVGGGPVSVDAAVTARMLGAQEVVLMYRRGLAEMPVTKHEREWLAEASVDIVTRTSPIEIHVVDGKVRGLRTQRVQLPHRSTGSSRTAPVSNSEAEWPDVDTVIIAIGQTREISLKTELSNVFFGGDCFHGASTVVEAAAGGKNMGLRMENCALKKEFKPSHENRCDLTVPAFDLVPVDLSVSALGIDFPDPFVMWGGKGTFDALKKAYDNGWGSAFVRAEGNAKSFQMACDTVEKLCKAFPSKKTMASIPVNDVKDQKLCASRTSVLEKSGACLIEYDLTVPMVNPTDDGLECIFQSVPLTKEVVKGILESTDDHVPKIFRLGSAVTSIRPVLRAIKEVIRSLNKKVPVGISLSAKLPTTMLKKTEVNPVKKALFAPSATHCHGQSQGSLPLSYNVLVEAIGEGLPIVGVSGGEFDYVSAAHLLALGASTIHITDLVIKETVSVISETRSSLAFFLKEKGFKNVSELKLMVASPVLDFMDLTAEKQIAQWDSSKCIHCENCTRCPCDAISSVPVSGGALRIMIRPDHCIGCSLCTTMCPSMALSMGNRCEEEVKAQTAGPHKHQAHLLGPTYPPVAQ